MILVEQLQNNILARTAQYRKAQRTSMMQVDLQNSLDCVLAEDIIAPFDLPRKNLSAMDGFALAAGSNLQQDTSFEVIGEICAGKDAEFALQKNQAVRIFTGAIVPDDCDTVVMQEHTSFVDAKMQLQQDIKKGANIRKQGEEVQQGMLLLQKNTRITFAHISLLASFGIAHLSVFAPLRVGIIATGDELCHIGDTLQNSAQIYNSNTPSIRALLHNMPIDIIDYGIIKDDLALIKTSVLRAIDECDVVISSAGVSVGDYDYLTQVVQDLGQIHHYKVAMKPGKPFVFGEFLRKNTLQDDAQNDTSVLYFGLPGNPLSTIIGMLQFVRPALWDLARADKGRPQNITLLATVSHDIAKKSGRKEFMRAIFTQKNKDIVVEAFNHQDSHRVKQLAGANCLLCLDADTHDIKKGDSVSIMPFAWCFA